MRTYYFAAENKDAMIQWMNAMSLASIGEQEKDLSKARLGSVSSAGGISLKYYINSFLHTLFLLYALGPRKLAMILENQIK